MSFHNREQGGNGSIPQQTVDEHGNPLRVLNHSAANGNNTSNNMNNFIYQQQQRQQQQQPPNNGQQDHQQKLLTDLLNAALRGGSTQPPIPSPAVAQTTILSQLQSILAPIQQQQPNEALLQQLQQAIQAQNFQQSISSALNNPSQHQATTSSAPLPNHDFNLQRGAENNDFPSQQQQQQQPVPPPHPPAASAAVVAAAQEDPDKQPTIVPCRARGMPPEHNGSVSQYRKSPYSSISPL